MSVEHGVDIVEDGGCTLPPRRQGQAAPPEILESRVAHDANPSPFPEAPGVVRSDTEFAGVDCVVLEPRSADRTILYFHGGGFFAGSPKAHAPYLAQLASHTGARVVGVRYGLAPEEPFPAALHDGMAVHRALSAQGSGNLVFAGDSAGGGLALSLALACRDEGAAMPSGLVLISPWVDLTLGGASYQTRAQTDLLFSREAAAALSVLYLQGHDPAHPLLSPVRADLAGLPPVQLFVGGAEVLLDENIALAVALAQANVTLEFHVAAGAQHVWPVLYPDLAESKRAVEAIARFVRG
jgi:acetyl esterase/lipase